MLVRNLQNQPDDKAWQKLRLTCNQLAGCPLPPMAYDADYLETAGRWLANQLGCGEPDHVLTIRRGDGHGQPQPKLPLWVIMADLRSAFNTGSILRTSECLQVQKVIFAGCTPRPGNRALAHTAMSTLEHLHWQVSETTTEAIIMAHEAGMRIYALETADMASPLYKTTFTKPAALVLGNEANGLDPALLPYCDEVVEIPVRGWKNSLNVASAYAVAAYEVLRQWSVND